MTQNEKDRKIVNQALDSCVVGDTDLICEAVRIADRLLTERENAEDGYLHDPSVLLSFRDQHSTCYFNKQECWNGIRGKKGVWIPDGEAE